MITIGKRWDTGAVYVGRPSPLGNPYFMRHEGERDQVCDNYRTWFYEQVEKQNPQFMDELRRLYRLSKQGDLILGCYCAPKRCHAETIKAFLENHS